MDSYVRFYVDNFLTILGPRHLKIFDFDQELLPRVPSTDAGVVYDISIGVENIHTPISLMEYDPAISTVFSIFDTRGKKYILQQLRRVAQEREFLRSLVQISEDETTGRKPLEGVTVAICNYCFFVKSNCPRFLVWIKFHKRLSL